MSNHNITCTINNTLEVIKRDGRRERVSFDKILRRIENICDKLKLTRINSIEIAKETINGLYNNITTEEIDHYSASKCAERIQDDPQYDDLAAGLCISRLHKMTSPDFMTVTNALHNNVDTYGQKNPLITDEYYFFVKENINRIQKELTYDRDYYFDFFGYKTMERSYLLRVRTSSNVNNTINNNKSNKDKKKQDESKIMKQKYGNIVERPQSMFMRVAIFLNMDSIENAIETYHLMSNRYFIFGSPTLYNAGNKKPQMSSCYLLGMADSIDGIGETVVDTMKISKWAGGIGIHLSDIRAKGSLIRGTNGNSDGLIKLIKVFNELGRYVNQGGRRNGAIACYIEPWHADIFEFCELKKNTGSEELRARDIFLALWVPDLFMKRVRDDGVWSLMCPDECPGLTTTYGDEFEQLYEKYEREGRFKKQINAIDLWYHILSSQIETGIPYMCFKDNVNHKSNQKNIGVIQSSNLCAEIVEYSDPDTIAVCNLSSICLQRFVEFVDGKPSYNYDKLRHVARIATRNLNRVIDINYYPIEKAKRSNFTHRPIGVGVQGLADVYCMFEIPFDSDEARDLNKRIFETIYYGCLLESCELAKIYGPYDTFNGSPFSKGILQYHMWGLTEDDLLMNYDWKSLIDDIKKYGIRNSLLTALMPTASTSQIMGSNECFEPMTQNLYLRSTLAGEYVIVNRYLIEKLIQMNLWNKEIRDEFKYDKGSLENIQEIPENIKNIFRTAFDMKTKPIIQQAIERGPFIDQSQSMNLFCKNPDFDLLTSALFYGWENGIKTGMYYLRSQPAVDPIDFGLDAEIIKQIQKKRGIVDDDSEDSDDVDEHEVDKDPRRINEIKSSINKGQSIFNCDTCGA